MQFKEHDAGIKPGTILVEFDNIIKTGDLFILRNIVNSYSDKFSKYIDLTGIATMSDLAYLPILIARNDKNIFKWLAKTEFDYDKNYDYFYHKYRDMYVGAPILRFGSFLRGRLTSPNINKVYFWSQDNDIRIGYEIKHIFGDGSKVAYVTGSLEECFTKFDKVDFVLVNDLEMIRPYLDNQDYNDIFFSVGKYGYNFDTNGELKGIDTEKISNISSTEIMKPQFSSFVYG